MRMHHIPSIIHTISVNKVDFDLLSIDLRDVYLPWCWHVALCHGCRFSAAVTCFLFEYNSTPLLLLSREPPDTRGVRRFKPMVDSVPTDLTAASRSKRRRDDDFRSPELPASNHSCGVDATPSVEQAV
jgi:hypothetical protein